MNLARYFAFSLLFFLGSEAYASLFDLNKMELNQMEMVQIIDHPEQPKVNSESPLHRCARNGQEQRCKDLVRSGQKVDATNDQGMTPFLTAMMYGNFEIALFLYLEGADINATDNFGRNALHYTILYHHHRLIRWLVRGGINVDQPDYRGWTPVFLAAAKCKEEHVLLLLNREANPNIQERITAMTPLMIAAWLGKERTVRRLLRHDADALLEDINGNQALHFAADQDNDEVVERFRGYNYDLAHKNRDGETPMDIAIKRKNEDIQKELSRL